MSESIKYRDGYKYQLSEDYQTVIEIKPVEFILTEYIRLDIDGTLSIKEGYAWDGPSGPTVDTKNFMRGSLVHDAQGDRRPHPATHLHRGRHELRARLVGVLWRPIRRRSSRIAAG